ncbi:MAG: hypothetical protein ACLPXZ_24730 [Mycobacterium sp.]
MSNLLELSDQLFFLGERATGATARLQGVWVYNRTIDLDGLRQFHHHLQRGRLSRRVERSPLPFGRHRWVLPNARSGLEIVAMPRPREEFGAWLDAQAATALDAELAPEWHLAMLPFIDGGAGVSLVVSHGLTDGIGLCEAVADAAFGRNNALILPAAGSRPRWRALREDARQTARDIPGISRAVVAAAATARSSRRGRRPATSTQLRSAPQAEPGFQLDERVTVPAATIFIDADEWDARADSLGGTSNAILAGLAARLAQKLGRVTADGAVTLTMPVNVRTERDNRANAVVSAHLLIDPEAALTDLGEIRAATKQALIRRQEVPDKQFHLLHIVPLVPERLVKRMVSLASGSDIRVDSSNVGPVNPDALRPDGTEADQFAIRIHALGATTVMMHRAGGLLTVFSGRAHRQVFVSVVAFQPGRPNSDDDLRQLLSSALRDFTLSATTCWVKAKQSSESSTPSATAAERTNP